MTVAFWVVKNYFVANELNTCNVAATGSSGLTWTYLDLPRNPWGLSADGT